MSFFIFLLKFAQIFIIYALMGSMKADPLKNL